MVTNKTKNNNFQNFIINGDFHSWSSGETFQCEGSSKKLADAWFGRRGNLVGNMAVRKIQLQETSNPNNAIRIERTEQDTDLNQLAVAQLLESSVINQLAGKTVLFSAYVRCGQGYSSQNRKLRLYLVASSEKKDFNTENPNPFSLGSGSITVASLPVKLSGEWNQAIASGQIPQTAKQIMVGFKTEDLVTEVAHQEDFFEITNVELEIDMENPELKNDEKRFPIFHVASMARSGETVLLRSLAAHPKIQNLVNVEKEEQDPEYQLFLYLQQYSGTTISNSHKLVSRLNLNCDNIILVKQGIWEHKSPFKGIVLVRNPISVFASLRSYGLGNNATQSDYQKRQNSSSRNFKRWLKDIDLDLLNYFNDLNFIEQFCAFYNRRMYPLSQLNLPIIHYEEFCKKPKENLDYILSYFGLEFDNSCLESHNYYPQEKIGHGNIKLSSPISSKSLDKWKNHVSQKQFNIIAALTYNTWKAFGYEIKWPDIIVREERKIFNQGCLINSEDNSKDKEAKKTSNFEKNTKNKQTTNLELTKIQTDVEQHKIKLRKLQQQLNQ